jgi:hypothetical protein
MALTMSHECGTVAHDKWYSNSTQPVISEPLAIMVHTIVITFEGTRAMKIVGRDKAIAFLGS